MTSLVLYKHTWVSPHIHFHKLVIIDTLCHIDSCANFHTHSRLSESPSGGLVLSIIQPDRYNSLFDQITMGVLIYIYLNVNNKLPCVCEGNASLFCTFLNKIIQQCTLLVKSRLYFVITSQILVVFISKYAYHILPIISLSVLTIFD